MLQAVKCKTDCLSLMSMGPCLSVLCSHCDLCVFVFQVSEGKKPLNGSASILRPGDHASVCSVVDEDTVLCEICMKHGTKWMCLKCTHKTCDFCRKNDMLLCKDQTREHIFVEFETTSSSSDHGEDGSQPVPQSYRRTAESLALKKVTFEGIEDLTESSTDSDLPRPNYRDSLALTKDKKQRLQDILKELQEMERVGQSRCEALSSYHDYMTDVKVAGFDLLGQAEMLLHDRVKEFFVKMRQDYEQGFNEMTSATEDIHDKMNSNLQSIQMNAAILEEIVENNDTRVMMDQEFLDGKCDEVEKSVVELAQTIVQCNSAGLRKSTTEWGTEEKSEFEKTMNCNILQAVEEEMEKSLYCEMREGVQKMRPEVDTVKPVKRVSRLMPHKDSKRKWYDCVIS